MDAIKESLTDEEVSDFAEALETACRDAIASGGTIGGVADVGATCCPVGALIGLDFPSSMDIIEKHTGVRYALVWSFVRAFEGNPAVTGDDLRLHDVGKQFEEQYRRGASECRLFS
jgi:hypothetical protein